MNGRDLQEDNYLMSSWLRDAGTSKTLSAILVAFADGAMLLGDVLRKAPILRQTGAIDEINVQGEQQKQLDVIADKIFTDALSRVPQIAAMVSEEVENVIHNGDAVDGADIVVCFDPLDGSSNIETNSAIGSIFSVLKVNRLGCAVTNEDILGASRNQIAAGYVLYGPSTLLVLTTGKSVSMFGLDPELGEFVLVQPSLVIPEVAKEFSINIAHRNFWDPSVTQYVDECIEGEAGPRKKRYNMRWAGSMVADVHRLFVRGGIFIYPKLSTREEANGKLRFLYEANPMAMLVETAGGLSISGGIFTRAVIPDALHQRVPVAMGSFDEVNYLGEIGNTNTKAD